MLQHHLPEQGLELLGGLVEAERTGPHVERGPVTVLAQPELGVYDQRSARPQAMNSAHQTRFAGIEAVLQVLHQRTGFELGLARP